MRAGRSRTSLLLGCGLIVLGLAGLALIYGPVSGPAPFSGWGGGGYYDKGSYASNGERIYYLGIDSEGDRIRTGGGPPWLYGMGGSCVNCHGPDGRGGFPVMMGTAVPTDIRYSKLVSGAHEGGGDDEDEGHRYTDEDILRAVTEAVGPDGRRFDPTMPRWKMDREDLTDLLNYLKTLG